MPVDPKKCCATHSKEKEKAGTCCQYHEEQVTAEQQTYEQSFITVELKEKNE